MKPKNNAVKRLGAAILLAAVAAMPAFVSADLIVDRGLPTINLNDAAGDDRSNVAWSGYKDTTDGFWLTGDTFSTPAGPQCRWTIDTIRIWSPATAVGSALGDYYSSIALYAGIYEASALQTLSSGNITGDSSDNTNITFTRVTYTGGSNYQDGTDEYQLWQVDFTNLNWVVDSLAVIEFGVDASGPGADFWYNHASNAALSGSTQNGTDNVFSQISTGGGVVGAEIYDVDSATDTVYDWDKSSDINVQVFATTPVPGALPLAVIGLLGLTAMRRTRAKAGVAKQPAC